jgi:hypothetical protein
MKHGRALNRADLSSYLRARALADRVITETLKRDPDRVVRAITFVVETLKSDGAHGSAEIEAGVAQLCRELGLPWKETMN